jgi:cell division protein FtsA
MSKFITLAAFDVGTYAVKGLCCKKNFDTGEVEVLSQSEVASSGLRSGETVRPERLAERLVVVKDELSKKGGCKIKEALVNVNGSHLFSLATQGLVSVSRADQRISQEDVARVLRAAQTIHLPANKEILDIYPLEYIIDNDGSVKDPVGLQGMRLEVKATLLGVFAPIKENLEKAFALAGISLLENPLPSPLAASRAVLLPEHKDLGCMVVDLGAACTSVTIFEKGDLKDFSVFPIGSANITNDIAICLRTEIQTAEIIKKQFGTLKAQVKKYVMAKKPKASKKGRTAKILEADIEPEPTWEEILPAFSPKLLKSIVEDRFNQLFCEIQKALKKITNGEPLPAGVFFTGGGSYMPGLIELAKQKLKLPCRLGQPRGALGCEDPKMATCLGLVLMGLDAFEEDKEIELNEGLKEKIKRLFRSFLP